jgi:hypothetical protein
MVFHSCGKSCLHDGLEILCCLVSHDYWLSEEIPFRARDLGTCLAPWKGRCRQEEGQQGFRGRTQSKEQQLVEVADELPGLEEPNVEVADADGHLREGSR